MTFAEYWAVQRPRNFPSDAAAREAAISAWDAALCAAQDAAFVRGEMQDSAALSRLHTWNQPSPSIQ